jgi:two-component system phosphate regulon response regulator PhoB
VAKILIVDDEPSIQEIVRELLRREGHEVVSARDSKAGIELIEKDHPDLITTDMNNSAVSGLEVVRAARKHDPSIPVIVLTGSRSKSKAMNAGACAFRKKPFEIRDFLNAVSAAFRQ